MLIRKWVAVAAALLISGAGLVSGSAVARPFTAKDLAMMDRVSDPHLSPDGRFIAYNLRSTDWDGNKGVNALQLIDRDHPDTKPLVLVEGERGALSPRWSRDGKWIYFLSARSGVSQVWRISPDGQNRTQMTVLPLDIGGFQLAPDERSLIALIDALPECATLACTKAAMDAKAQRKASGILITGSARPWTSAEDELFTGLFSVPLATGGAPTEAIPLLRNFRGQMVSGRNFVITKDGKKVYFVSYEPNNNPEERNIFPTDIDTAKIYVAPTDGSSAPRRLSLADTTHYLQLALSPDGAKIAILGFENWDGAYASTALMLLDLKKESIRKIAPQLDYQIRAFAWSSDGSSILAAGPDTGQAPLLSINVATGNVRKLHSEGEVADFDSAVGVTIYVANSFTSPGQIFDIGSSGPPRQLTHIGAEVLAEAPMAPAEQFSFAGWNGEKVYGWVVKPQNFVEGQKYPVAFLIHGGPYDTFDNGWGYRWNSQLWASMGYAVVMIDFHGSGGYGDTFSKSVVGHWGDRPLEDLQKGWAYALSRYSWLDGNNACALGASYGGYMINWIASQWNSPWKCLVSHAGIFDMRFWAVSGDLPSYYTAQNPGLTPFSPEAAERFNPLSYADKWKTPMLIIHGGMDVLVPVTQGIAAYTAAKQFHVPTKLLIFPDEGHWITKPQNSVQWYATVEAWMKRWTGK